MKFGFWIELALSIIFLFGAIGYGFIAIRLGIDGNYSFAVFGAGACFAAMAFSVSFSDMAKARLEVEENEKKT